MLCTKPVSLSWSPKYSYTVSACLGHELASAGPHLCPDLVRHISSTRMGVKGREVLVYPSLEQYKTTENGLATITRRHTQLAIQIRQGHCSPSDLILIGVHI